MNNPTPLFPIGEEISDGFTGREWIKWLVERDETFNCPIANATFEPGWRTHWHKHPGGQILLVTNGAGYYQEEGKPVRRLQPGDVVKVAPNVKHWHGATASDWISHLAIETNSSSCPVEWLEPVTDKEYDKLQSHGA